MRAYRRSGPSEMTGAPLTANGKDFCSEAGARELAARIRAFWGGRPTVAVEHVSYGKKKPVYVVRSDMLNGLPRRAAR